MYERDKINQLRKKIDVYDDKILDLLVRRFDISKEIGQIKKSLGLSIGDPYREQEIIKRLAEKLEGKLEREDIAAIFGTIYRISKIIQKRNK